MPWNVTNAVTHLQTHAAPHSTGYCATYVREAIEAGGVTFHHPLSAKGFGPGLQAAGFAKIDSGTGYLALAGDVAIIQPVGGKGDGHMAMYDGTHWISDFVQMHGLYPGASYRKAKPPYAIYRHN